MLFILNVNFKDIFSLFFKEKQMSFDRRAN